MTDEKIVNFPSDPAEIWMMFHQAVSGHLAFDIGANGGMVSTILADHFDKIIAFEPHPASYAYLSEHHPDNVVPLNLALSDKAGELVLDTSALLDGWGELSTGEGLRELWGDKIDKVTVTATTLDDMVKIYGAPDFVKIDTEGHEAHIVRGGFSFFTHHKPKLIIEIHSVAAGEEVSKLLWEYDLTVVRHPAYRGSGYRHDNHYYLVGI